MYIEWLRNSLKDERVVYEKAIRNHSVGLLFTLNSPAGERKLLLASDTGLFPLDPDAKGPLPATDGDTSEIHHCYRDAGGMGCDLMILHIGSVKKQELNPAEETDPRKGCYPNHMGIIGVTRTILACRPKLALISEFGEEMKKIRVRLMEHIQQKVIDVALNATPPAERPRVLPADPGFVFDVGLREFVDWADRAWKPIAKIGFGQPKERTTGDVGYFEFSQDPVTARSRAGNAIDNFNKCLHEKGGHLSPSE